MNYGFFVKNQIRHHRFLFIAGAVQIAAAFVLILMLFSELSGFFSASGMFAHLNSGSYLFITATSSRIADNNELSLIYNEQFAQLINKFMEEDPDISILQAADKAREQIGEDPSLDNNINESVIAETPYYDDICMIYVSDLLADDLIRAMSPALANSLNVDMRSGKWLDNAASTSDTIDIVVFKNTMHSVGDIIPIKYTVYNNETQTSEWADTGYSARVIGICEYDQNCPEFGTTATSFDSMNLYDLTENYGMENICAALHTDLQPLLDKYGYSNAESRQYMGAIIKLKDDLSAEQISEAKQYLTQNRYSAESMTRFYGNTIDAERNSASNIAVPAVVAGCFSILSISAISVFQLQNSTKKFRIYYYCGMESGKEKYIHMLYILCMTLSGALISIAAYEGIGFYGYVHRINALCGSGYSLRQAQSWTSLKDYIYIAPLSVGFVFLLAIVINIVSTVICTAAKGKE